MPALAVDANSKKSRMPKNQPTNSPTSAITVAAQQWGFGELCIANSLQRREVCEKATRAFSGNPITGDMICSLVDH
jgi:hypothetical protein